jgi:endonuclease YncB( thermonuclease family)
VIIGLSLAQLVPGAPYATGDDWSVLSHSVIDGDTIRAHLEGWVEGNQLPVAVNGVVLTEWTRITLDPLVYPRGASCRLLYVNTPEKGKQLGAPLPDGRAGTWAQGGEDVARWLDMYSEQGIRAETWSYEGNLGRLLADFYVEGDRGRTLSQYMLRVGWPAYTG